MESGQQFSHGQDNVKSASAAATESLVGFESAMNQLVSRMEITGEQIQKIIEVKDRAEKVIDRIVGVSQSAMTEVKKSPKSYLALGLIVGWLVVNHVTSIAKPQIDSQMH
jgi:hypothetical protein